ncbi:hypothetical protein QBC37DRAFT_402904 [Rhypophila decipiens]|uniref:Uncharacterized protein n=1 Tax=Rhypophila decipiens TaxID=261697 RepID=A0AAN6Y7R0_9PEZI|nr:hypothetical protein QBC37DRAFT_402904 [Rhypophila decipiens]
MTSRRENQGPTTPNSLTEGLEARIRDLARKLAHDNATWAEQLRNVRDQERNRYESHVEVATWQLNTTSEAMRLLRDRAQAYRMQYEEAVEELEELKEEQRIEYQRRKMEAASTSIERLQVELQQLRRWKQEAKEHRRYLADRVNEVLTRYNELNQYEKDIAAQLEAADQEIRRLRQQLDAHVRALGNDGPQGTLSDQIASIKQGLEVASEEIEQALFRRGILKTAAAQLSSPPSGQSKADPPRPSARRPPPSPKQTSVPAPAPARPIKAVPTPEADFREPDDAGDEETTVDDTFQDDRSDTTPEEGDTEATDYTQEDSDIEKWPEPEAQEEEGARESREPDSAAHDKEICRSYNKILRDIEEMVEGRESRKRYIYTFDDVFVSSVHEGTEKAAHSCFLCNFRGGWDSVSIRDRKLRARSSIFDIIYNILLIHCEWTEAEESVEMVLWFLKRCKVPSNEIQIWITNTYHLFPDKQPGAGRAVDATRKVFEYFQPILSPSATRLDRTELLKRISLICHATHALGKKLYDSRIYELRRVPPGKASRVPANTFWIDRKVFGEKQLECEAGPECHECQAAESGTEVAYGLSAALLKHERRIEDLNCAPSITVLEKAQVVIHRRSEFSGWGQMPLLFRVAVCVALILLYFQYIIWLPDIWHLSEMPVP